MPRILNKLSILTVDKIKKPGAYADGGNLYLQVTGKGNKSWLFRYSIHGRAREMGLGPLHTVSLAKARLKANDCRNLLLAGIDPLETKKTEQTAARLAAVKGTTFEACAKTYIDAHKASWKQERHAAQWTQALTKHVYPTIGALPIDAVDTNLILKVLEPIWTEKTETAKRLRGRMECILDWAKVREYRQGENPARWRGHLENLLASPNTVSIDEVACKLDKVQCNPENANALAHRIKDAIRGRVGEYLKCSIGIASNQLLAKLASDMQKPDGLTILHPDHMPQAILHLRPKDICGIGRIWMSGCNAPGSIRWKAFISLDACLEHAMTV